MIKWSDKMKKSVNIFNSIANELLKEETDIDGIIDVFNNGLEEGVLLKIYDKFNPASDLCIWAYLPTERDCDNQMKVIIGTHNDCDNSNHWKEELPFKIFTEARAKELHNKVRNYLMEVIRTRMDKKIEKKER